MIRESIAHYRITTKLGEGGMGEVYRATDTKLGRDVAIKVLPNAFADDSVRMSRFQREAQVLAALNHPNIAHVYGVEERALVMELVEGESPKGPMPFDDAWKIASQIAHALEYAHDNGFIHRDLKPANIKVTPDGVVKLLDFGLAKALGGDAAPASAGDPSNSPTLTMGATVAGTIMGTAAYMAPEQARGKRVDRRADIWAFGVVLYELLTGQQLFKGEDITETLASVVKDQPDLRAVPGRVRKLLEECLQKDPKKRLQAIGDARYLLEETPRSKSHGTKLPWTLAAAFAVMAMSVAFIHFRQTPQERTQRYTIASPENTTSITGLAISPDGRLLTIAATIDGKQQLWLRSLDSLQFRPLLGTDGVASPFWSPDSRYIGFAAQGKLRKIATSGGPAQSLCDFVGGFGGGSWSRDDLIVFSANDTVKSILKVPASGGVPVRVTASLDSRYPAFLPNGRYFLYSVTQAAAQQQGIYVGSVDGKENRRILSDRSGAVFAPSGLHGSMGQILFLRENTLMAQPFNADAAQVSGDAFAVAEGINFNGGFLLPVAVSGNDTLLYWTGGVGGGGGGGYDIVLYDRAGKVLRNFVPGSVPGKIDVRSPSFSPDRNTVGYVRTGGDIWLYDLVRGTDRRFTSGPAANAFPVWSPQGDRIVFRSNRNSSAGDLYLKPVSGSGQEQVLLANGNDKIDYQWAPDGLIVYSELDPKTGRDLWVLQASKGATGGAPEIWKPTPFLQTQFNEFQGQLSPDSKWMAYTSEESGQREVYVRPFPAADAGFWKISTAGGAQPRWRGDGKELYYVAADGKMAAVTVKAIAGSKQGFEPGTPEVLFDPHIAGSNNLGHFFNYDVTADGTRFVVIRAPSTDSSGPLAPLTLVLNWNADFK
jgi:serine/threonine protein kinase